MSKSTQQSNTELTPEQIQQIQAQTDFFTGTIAPTYKGAVQGATDLYNQNAGGLLNAAQNQAGIARQAQESLGSTGESALRSGITGLQSLFDPNYEANQIQAALMPAQGQYLNNLEMQNRSFGGSGNLGSARQALADRQMAGANQAAQMQAIANVQQQIAGQRMGAAGTLAQLGQSGIGQALGASGDVVDASMMPQELYNKYASVIFGTPAASYNPDFGGTQSKSSTTLGLNPMGIKIG